MTVPHSAFADLRTADPATTALVAAIRRRERRAERLTNPLGRTPLVGSLIRVFWYLVLAEGDPRDGLIFSFLNDGLRPTLWHTVLQILRPEGDPDIGIWTLGAPRSRAEAQALQTCYQDRL
jgi:hypothetical protein